MLSICYRNVVPKVRVELTRGHRHRFLSWSPCVPIGLSSPVFFNGSCLQRTNAFIMTQGNIGAFVHELTGFSCASTG